LLARVCRALICSLSALYLAFETFFTGEGVFGFGAGFGGEGVFGFGFAGEGEVKRRFLGVGLGVGVVRRLVGDFFLGAAGVGGTPI